ncbi:MAG: hypothetical protein II431_03085, partial [Prevotella sp.]|nr:hypothetical protein [Prevotella sp.]
MFATTKDGICVWKTIEIKTANALQSSCTTSGESGLAILLSLLIFWIATQSEGCTWCILHNTSTCEDKLPNPCRVSFKPSAHVKTNVSCIILLMEGLSFS